MITVRPANTRGHANQGWLDSHFTFSFADYHDPAHLHFSRLRVINEDTIAPGGGFPMHPHADMEIITYVMSGALEHRDSMGNGAVIRAGDVQYMRAGTGVRHSEFNPSDSEPAHLLQIWILPAKRGLPPTYEQRHIEADDARGKLSLLASGDGQVDAITVNQDVSLYLARLHAGDTVTFPVAPGRCVYAQVAQGDVVINGTAMTAGDGAEIRDETGLMLATHSDGEVLLFDLP